MNAGVKIQNNMKHFDVSGYELDPDSLKALKKTVDRNELLQ